MRVVQLLKLGLLQELQLVLPLEGLTLAAQPAHAPPLPLVLQELLVKPLPLCPRLAWNQRLLPLQVFGQVGRKRPRPRPSPPVARDRGPAAAGSRVVAAQLLA
jgi:hypothetical protein